MHPLVMKIILVMRKIICASFLPTLTCNKKKKINELISAIHEKDELLDSQEDFLIKENKKHVKVKNAYALEVEKCEKVSSELSTCHCWGPSTSEGPQKCDLTMFLEYNT